MSELRILIVEDEAVTAADLHDELIAQGCEVAGTAASVSECIVSPPSIADDAAEDPAVGIGGGHRG